MTRARPLAPSRLIAENRFVIAGKVRSARVLREAELDANDPHPSSNDVRVKQRVKPCSERLQGAPTSNTEPELAVRCARAMFDKAEAI